MKYRIVLILMLFSSYQYISAETGNLNTYIDNIISGIPSEPGGGQYLQPSLDSRNLWKQMVQYIIEKDYDSANTLAAEKNYELIPFQDTSTYKLMNYHILQRKSTSTSRFWGTFVFNDSPTRPDLIIQSPHPLYDRNTGNIGIRVFQSASAWVYFVAGTHRCNGTVESSCSGTTSACSGSSEPYRYSDQAHVVDGLFQITTEVLLAENPEIIIVQPHGFSKGDSDPHIIMSNGSTLQPNRLWLEKLRKNFSFIDPSLTYKISHLDNWTRLIATTNTQGRLLNNSSSPCGTAASENTGNFIHLEMAYSGLRDNSSNWMKLANAIFMTVPAESLSDSNRFFYQFDGIDDYIEYDNEDNLQLFNDADEYSIELSFRIDSFDNVDDFDRVLDLKDQVSIYLKKDSTITFAINADGWKYYKSLSGVFSENIWYHLLATRYYDGGYHFELLLDGKNIMESPNKIGYAVPASTSSQILTIANRVGFDNYFAGDMDRVKLSLIGINPNSYIIPNFEICEDVIESQIINFDFADTNYSYITENNAWPNSAARLGNKDDGDDSEPILISHTEHVVTEIQAFANKIALTKNYPNPFNNMTTIYFPVEDFTQFQLKVYNTLGKLVYKYEGTANYPSQEISFNSEHLSSGIYYYRITTDKEIFNGKMVYLK